MAATVTKLTKLWNDEATLAEKDSETMYFHVYVAEDDALPLEVAYAVYAGKPQRGSPHPYNEFLTASSVNAKRYKGSGPEVKNVWQLKVDYTLPDLGGGGPTGETANSTNIRVRVSGQETAVYTQLQRDEDETPITNAVGDMYPDPQEVVLYDEVISISFEKPAIDMDGIAEMRGCINNSAITLNIPQGALTFSRTFAKETLLLKTCDYETVVSVGNSSVNLFGVDVLLLYRSDGWKRKLPEKGYRYYDADDNLTKWKEQAFYLNEVGQKLGEGESIVTTDPVQLNYSKDLASFLQGI